MHKNSHIKIKVLFQKIIRSFKTSNFNDMNISYNINCDLLDKSVSDINLNVYANVYAKTHFINIQTLIGLYIYLFIIQCY